MKKRLLVSKKNSILAYLCFSGPPGKSTLVDERTKCHTGDSDNLDLTEVAVLELPAVNPNLSAS